MIRDRLHLFWATLSRGALNAILVCMCGAVLLGGCATRPPESDPVALAEYKETNDPIEPLNRYFFAINSLIDAFVLKPAAVLYDWSLPKPVKNSVRSFFNNLETPVTLANDIFQGEWGRAKTTTTRFAINTTAGIGGLIDWASPMGYPYHSEDFGQTLAVHGVGSGPYLYLPVLGPSNPRDGIGYAADTMMNPMTYVLRGHDKVRFILFTSNAIDRRSRAIEVLDEIERSSVDYYASLRSLSRQRRADEIRNGKPDFESLPDLSASNYGSDDAVEEEPKKM